jgi:hypothetical protein
MEGRALSRPIILSSELPASLLANAFGVRSIAWLDVWRDMLWNISNLSPILLSNVFVDLDGG